MEHNNIFLGTVMQFIVITILEKSEPKNSENLKDYKAYGWKIQSW